MTDQLLTPAPASPSPSDEVFRLIVESATDYAIFTTDGEGCITTWNIGAERVLGYNAGEILGRDGRILFTPEDVEHGQPEAEMHAARERGRAEDRRWHLHKDGHRLWADGLLMPLRDDAKRVIGFLKIIRDRTAERRTEEAMRQAERDLRLMLESATDFAIFSVTPEGRVASWNTAAQRLFGYAEGEIIGRESSILYTPEDRAEGAPKREMETARERGRAEDERWHPKKDGGRFYSSGVCTPIRDEAGTLVGFTKVWRDITERRRAEEQLREGEERFRLMADSIPQIVWMTDADGRTEFFNRQWVAYTGVPYEPSTAVDIAAGFVHPDDGPRTLAAFEEARRTGTTFRVEHRIRSASGEYRWFLVRAEPHRDPASGAVVRWFGTSTDIHEAKLAQAALKESEGRLQLLDTLSETTRSLADPAAIMAETTRLLAGHLKATRCAYADVEADGDRFTIRNDWCDGVPSSVGIYSLDFFGPRAAADMRAGRSLVVRDVDAELRPEEGAEMFNAIGIKAIVCCPLVKEGRLAAMMAVHQATPRPWSAREVALVEEVVERSWAHIERARAVEELRVSEERFRRTADHAPVLIWLAGTDGLCYWFNRPWLEFTGRTMEQERGTGWAEGIHPDDSGRCLETYTTSFDARRPFRMEYRLRHRSGRYRWVVDNGIPLHGVGGEFVGYIGSCVDIHDRVEAEELLRENDRKKNEFLAMLAHELRNPLAGITSAIRLARRPGLEDQVPYAHEVIERQARNLARLIDDLLDVSRITQGKVELRREITDVPSAVNRAAEAVRPLIEQRRHELTIRLAAGPMHVDADPTRLEQVVVNLLTNAAKYTDEGGAISVSVERRGGEVVIAVKDTGVGIPPEMLPKVFDLFTQVDPTLARTEGGLGIGLTLVKRLVELHGGAIAASSEPGRGSEFTVRLPLVEEVPERARVGEVRDASGRGRRVLIVDDNADTARPTGRMLQAMGFDVHLAHDGPASIEAARRHRPEVVLLDIGLPGMSGFEVARRLRREECCRDTLIIGVSGYGDLRSREQAHEAGFDHHLVKPVDVDELASLIGDAAEDGGSRR